MTSRSIIKTVEARKTGWRPPTGLPGTVFWLTVWFVLLWVLRYVPGFLGSLAGLLQVLVGLALLGVSVALVSRLVRQHMLWSLRNKLVLTYLLIGLAPATLFLTFVTISAYIAAGQFAIHLAETRLQAELDQMANDATFRTRGMARYMETHGYTMPPAGPPQVAANVGEEDTARSSLRRETLSFLNGAPLDMGGTTSRTKAPLGLPPWAAELPGLEFHGLVMDGGELYLVAVHQHRLADGRIFSMESSLPVDASVIDMIANGLGRAGLLPSGTGGNAPSTTGLQNSTSNVEKAKPQRRRLGSGGSSWISGGNEPRE